MKYKIAISSTDGKIVNQHFGRTSLFYIVEVDSESRKYQYLNERKTEPLCVLQHHKDEELSSFASQFGDCQYVIVSRIGNWARLVLESKGILAYEIPGIISESIDKLLTYIEVQNLLNGIGKG